MYSIIVKERFFNERCMRKAPVFSQWLNIFQGRVLAVLPFTIINFDSSIEIGLYLLYRDNMQN